MKKIILKEPVDGAVVPLLPRYISEYLTGGKPIAAAGGSVDWSSPELEGVERAHPLPVTLLSARTESTIPAGCCCRSAPILRVPWRR